MGTRGSFPGGKSSQGMKLTPHLHLVLRSRMCGAIPLLHQYIFIVWCLVENRDNFTFTLHSINHTKQVKIRVFYILSLVLQRWEDKKASELNGSNKHFLNLLCHTIK
jgi:hypothetical protein